MEAGSGLLTSTAELWRALQPCTSLLGVWWRGVEHLCQEEEMKLSLKHSEGLGTSRGMAEGN